MAELFPTKQTFVDEKLANGEQIVVTRVTIVNATTDHVKLPRFVDAQLLQTARTTADPTFYPTNDGTRLNIDGATVGTQYVIASRHQGMLNYDKGDNPTGGL
jgi:hypothetical protein